MVLEFGEVRTREILRKANFEKGGGLLPAVIQDASNDHILMQAFMNREALEKTLRTGRAHYWSRTRNRIWMKGEESGHVQLVQSIAFDCDYDAILLRVQQTGACCHTGKETCFHNPVNSDPGP